MIKPDDPRTVLCTYNDNMFSLSAKIRSQHGIDVNPLFIATSNGFLLYDTLFEHGVSSGSMVKIMPNVRGGAKKGGSGDPKV
jgi:hypothetical protein